MVNANMEHISISSNPVFFNFDDKITFWVSIIQKVNFICISQKLLERWGIHQLTFAITFFWQSFNIERIVLGVFGSDIFIYLFILFLKFVV
jgi:hypothetical protein